MEQAETRNTIKEVRNQAEEAFDKDIVDIDGHSIVRISRFVVAATGDINESARKYIGKARLSGVHRGIDYWTGDRLAEFIQKSWMTEFEDYFRAQLADVSDEHDEPEEVIVDTEYINDNYADEVAKCRRLRATVSGTEWDIFRAVVEQTCFQGVGSRAEMSDLLLAMECQESTLQEEFEHLQYLGYLEFEGSSLRLSGHANDLSALARVIVKELVDAEEDEEQAGKVFDVVTKRDKHRL